MMISKKSMRSVPNTLMDYFTWKKDSYSKDPDFAFQNVDFGNFSFKSFMEEL